MLQRAHSWKLCFVAHTLSPSEQTKEVASVSYSMRFLFDHTQTLSPPPIAARRLTLPVKHLVLRGHKFARCQTVRSITAAQEAIQLSTRTRTHTHTNKTLRLVLPPGRVLPGRSLPEDCGWGQNALTIGAGLQNTTYAEFYFCLLALQRGNALRAGRPACPSHSTPEGDRMCPCTAISTWLAWLMCHLRTFKWTQLPTVSPAATRSIFTAKRQSGP